MKTNEVSLTKGGLNLTKFRACRESVVKTFRDARVRIFDERRNRKITKTDAHDQYNAAIRKYRASFKQCRKEATEAPQVTMSCENRVKAHCNRVPEKHRANCNTILLQKRCKITTSTPAKPTPKPETPKPTPTTPKPRTTPITRPTRTVARRTSSSSPPSNNNAITLASSASAPTSPACVAKVEAQCGRIRHPAFKARCRKVLTGRYKECK